MNWASKPKSATGDEALLGEHTYRGAITAGAGAGAGAGASGAGGGTAGASGAGAAEQYPGQFLGLPPPPGFLPPTVGAGGAGPIRTDTRAVKVHPPYYPSMNPMAMGARLPTA